MGQHHQGALLCLVASSGLVHYSLSTETCKLLIGPSNSQLDPDGIISVVNSGGKNCNQISVIAAKLLLVIIL